MLNILFKTIEFIISLNEKSKKLVITSDQIRELQENYTEFKDLYDKIEKKLNETQKTSANEAKEIKNILDKLWQNYGDLIWYLDEIRDIIAELSLSYIPPDNEEAIKYKKITPTLPTEKALHKKSLEPLYFIKKREEIVNPYKDTYILIPISSGYIVNDNYHGITVLNEDLTIRKVIFLYEGFNINRWFYYKHFMSDKFVFYESFDERLAYVDIDSGKHTFIKFYGDIKTLSPLLTYFWQENTLIIINENKTFYMTDIDNAIMKPIGPNKVKQRYPYFYQYAYKAMNYDIIRAYSHNYSFIYRDFDNQEVGFYDFNTNKTVRLKFYDPEVHDIQYNDSYFMFIKKENIEIRKSKIKKVRILPHSHYDFYDAVFKKENNKLLVIALAKYFRVPQSASAIIYEILEDKKP